MLENVFLIISSLSKIEKKRENIYHTTETKRVGRIISCEKNKKTAAACFSFNLQSFPASGSFPTSQLFASGGKSIGASPSATILSNEYSGWIFMALIENGNTDMAS